MKSCIASLIKPTSFVAIEDTGHAHQVDGHTQLSVRLDVQGLLSRQARSEPRSRVLPAREAGIRDVEQLRGVRRRRQSIGVSNASDEVLVDHALAGARRRHVDGRAAGAMV